MRDRWRGSQQGGHWQPQESQDWCVQTETQKLWGAPGRENVFFLALPLSFVVLAVDEKTTNFWGDFVCVTSIY
jgi:hypothetical protein